MSFAVRYSASARDDLIRLYQFLLDRASTVEDLDVAERALSAITSAVDSLGRSPFIYRKAGQSPFLRELLIPFGHSGYVALFEIEDASTVTILAVRHQLEDDYH
ncbi:MAG: type II toxin-antitoxin system RelE/ParE family toxin [Hydrogenophaga sp.]|uniref:type II toxin-antitoxin system RelE/ParE family toxin n=1 Tax=Hydrogenophaga sp. TaxID=1904254 RepID=UPI0008CACB45|nr:type II toxin-antitoxin system RelE/ParE family toxin [Hydrogenophaga sp.]MBU4180919.1 type II toxin-antitoxin system RelE/ParE family toxin [Gammaproteobacteria bacterium]OGB34703.1 MAG: plasmid stabilization protein [Burkholderiales bacterium RIFCSPLOWO2_02_FULL_66_35]OGB43193.1 MAG: plasmid stabilization protein [Burkholderiales bacterium RIFCSPHIGHO2_12_FULL_67_38]PKO77379.1 MAG: type II toxin-antitoxin system RelE/ParE family toxin [Betaproteobacteria bacterium HGW-Betaproteobacteria-15